MNALAGTARIRARRDLLYRFGLVGGLGPGAKAFADLSCQLSSNAWAGNLGGVGSAINGGSPLEVSVRSDRWPEVRFATCVGTPGLTPFERLRQGTTAAKHMFHSLASQPVANANDWKYLEEWTRLLKTDQGTFGCYLGGSRTLDHFRVKLYLDLFAGGSAPGAGQQALTSWFHLLESFPQERGDSDSLQQLLPMALPVMGCIEWDSQGQRHWKLYWRLNQSTPGVMGRVGDFFSVPRDFCQEAYQSFLEAAGGYSKHPPITGFVHAAPASTGMLGFYSSAPSRWGYTGRKQRQIRMLWKTYGGDPPVLAKVWQIARGPTPRRWAPVLTIIGIGMSKRSAPTMTAYFCPHHHVIDI